MFEDEYVVQVVFSARVGGYAPEEGLYVPGGGAVEAREEAGGAGGGTGEWRWVWVGGRGRDGPA